MPPLTSPGGRPGSAGMWKLCSAMGLFPLGIGTVGRPGGEGAKSWDWPLSRQDGEDFEKSRGASASTPVVHGGWCGRERAGDRVTVGMPLHRSVAFHREPGCFTLDARRERYPMQTGGPSSLSLSLSLSHSPIPPGQSSCAFFNSQSSRGR